MTRPPDDNTPPDAPHARGTDADPHRGEVSEARPDLLRRLLDTLGWESGTEEQAIEALADAVRVARGGRMGKDVHLQRNEARAECERLRGALRAAREAVGEGWLDEDRTLAEAIRRKVAALETHLRGLTRELMARSKHPTAPVEAER